MRRTLAESHVAAVSIAILLLWAIVAIAEAIWEPLSRLLNFALNAVLILDIPYHATGFTAQDSLSVVVVGTGLLVALACLIAAWVLAKWIYGRGPLAVLGGYHQKMRRSHD